MPRYSFASLAILCFTLTKFGFTSELPNIVVILADDLGWSDLGCQGGDLVETPHIDQLAREGVRFTQAYAMPVCSPSRATLMTGRHAARLGITIWSEGSLNGPKNRRLLQAKSSHDLPHSEITLALLLQEAGYLTALVGKWHLGDAGHFPETHGFDINIGGTHWGAPTTFFYPYRGAGRFGAEYRYVPHLEWGQSGEYLTDRLTHEAIQIIRKSGEQPFFLYLAHHAPHTPIEAKPDDIDYFKSRLTPDLKHQNPVYAAMIRSLDDSVGRIRSVLQEFGTDRSTLFIFTSDNGGFIGTDRRSGQNVPVTSNYPLRSGKGSCYEGGIRVPLIIQHPGVTNPGTVTEPVYLADLFPTILTAAGISSPGDRVIDGLDLTPLLTRHDAQLGRESLYFHYPHYYETTSPVSAIRTGDWKLLEYFEDQSFELYNLKDDPSEARNIAGDFPDRAAELRANLHRWRETVQAQLPSPNPDWRSP